MGDSGNPTNTPSFSLPPGCRFYPSDEQLVCYYLTSKNNNDQRFGFDVIKELDLYNYDPFNLPDAACFRFCRGGRKRHWYCYVSRVLKGSGRRRAGGGYWKQRGKVRDVMSGGAGKVAVGTKTIFGFYLGDSTRSAVRTDWVMYEYALIDHNLASFVLCRVFVKSRRGNSISEHVLSSCGEESVARVRHIGVQHDGKVQDDHSVDHENEVLRYPVGLVSELDDRVTTEPVAEQMRSSGHISSGTIIFEALATKELIALLEEDFIELDDLVCPLPGID